MTSRLAVSHLARTLFASLFLCWVSLAAAQQPVVSYTFNGATGTPNQTAAGVSASQFVRDNSADTFYDSTAGNPAPDANSSGWTTAAALDPALYYTFSVTANTGGASWNTLTLDLANFDAAAINDGPAAFTVRSSLDGFTATLLSGSVGATFAHYTVPLGAATSVPVEYRIYGFRAGSADGLLQVDNVTLILAVPEPSATAALFAAGTLAGWYALQRRARPVVSPAA